LWLGFGLNFLKRTMAILGAWKPPQLPTFMHNPAMAARSFSNFHEPIAENVGPTNDNGADGKVACRSRLGGLLNYYYREAA
jgi:hypothetical protein